MPFARLWTLLDIVYGRGWISLLFFILFAQYLVMYILFNFHTTLKYFLETHSLFNFVFLAIAGAIHFCFHIKLAKTFGIHYSLGLATAFFSSIGAIITSMKFFDAIYLRYARAVGDIYFMDWLKDWSMLWGVLIIIPFFVTYYVFSKDFKYSGTSRDWYKEKKGL